MTEEKREASGACRECGRPRFVSLAQADTDDVCFGRASTACHMVTITRLRSELSTLRQQLEAERQGVWIPVGERMPEPNQHVLFRCAAWNEAVGLGPYQPDARLPWRDLTDVDMCGDANRLGDYEVTHWMPLPPPPAGKETE